MLMTSEGQEIICLQLKLQTNFNISKENNSAYKCNGINFIRTTDAILINQESYTNSLPPIEISREDKQNKDESLTYREMQDLHTFIGQISWLTGVLCPDLCFEIV